MATVSAVVNTRNEERNIRNCLETLGWCDEIVVVDMESEDRTVEIAREYTDLVFTHPKVAAFDIAKRFAVGKSTKEWVLVVDADEMVPVHLARLLKAVAAEGEADVVTIPFRHLMMGEVVRHSGWGYTPLPRFFRRGTVELSGRVHDYMRVDGASRVRELDLADENCIVHFNYLDSSHFVQKLNLYTSIEAQQLHEKGTRFSLLSLITSSLAQFSWRFFRNKGYRDGLLGFHLSFMMAFYKGLVQVKLWELQRHEAPVAHGYDNLKRELLTDWRDEGSLKEIPDKDGRWSTSS